MFAELDGVKRAIKDGRDKARIRKGIRVIHAAIRIKRKKSEGPLTRD
jgi:hypothetical protein